MNAQPEQPATQAGTQEQETARSAGAQPDEAQLRAAYEAELSKIESVDMVLQATASLLNIGAYRLGLTGAPGAGTPADLEQVRDAIDAVRGLMPVIERSAATESRPLRDALSQLQMAYTRVVQAAGAQAPEQTDQQRTTPAGQTGQASPQGQDQAGGTAGPGQGGGDSAAGSESPTPQNDPHQPGPAESSGRLWVPGR